MENNFGINTWNACTVALGLFCMPHRFWGQATTLGIAMNSEINANTLVFLAFSIQDSITHIPWREQQLCWHVFAVQSNTSLKRKVIDAESRGTHRPERRLSWIIHTESPSSPSRVVSGQRQTDRAYMCAIMSSIVADPTLICQLIFVDSQNLRAAVQLHEPLCRQLYLNSSVALHALPFSENVSAKMSKANEVNRGTSMEWLAGFRQHWAKTMTWAWWTGGRRECMGCLFRPVMKRYFLPSNCVRPCKMNQKCDSPSAVRANSMVTRWSYSFGSTKKFQPKSFTNCLSKNFNSSSETSAIFA